MHLSEIYIYPIKSLGGIPLKQTKLTDRGLEYDRRFMLTTLDGEKLSQREAAEMALLRTDIANDKIIVWPKNDPGNILEIPTQPSQFQKEQEVHIFGAYCIGGVMPEEYNQWFSQLLEITCQLVYMPDSSHRPLKEKYSTRGELVSFADGSPILIVGQSSLDDLNSRLDENVPMDRFRPNLVFTGGTPFAEDNWDAFKIGDIPFKATHRCVRCQIPNINQETAQMENEPNRTLAKFRRFDRKIYFGVNIVWEHFASHKTVGLKIEDKIMLLPERNIEI